jgi:hypothetical protein
MMTLQCKIISAIERGRSVARYTISRVVAHTA